MAFLEEWERAVRFYGASQVEMERMGRRRVPADEAFLMPLIARTREALGAKAFAAAVDAGRALGYESAFRGAQLAYECALIDERRC